jgi:hypothetical protein
MKSEWQPIETAPKDGTHFLGIVHDYVVECWWSGDWGRFDHALNDDNPPLPQAVTYWMPPPRATQMTPLRLRILHALRLQPMTCAFLARCLGYATRPEQRIVWASLERLGMTGKVRRDGRVYALRNKVVAI